MKWEKVKLGDYINILSGFPFASNGFNDKKGTPIIRIRDVVRGYTETFFNGEYNELYIIEEGDILIGMDGEFNVSKWSSGPALLNQRVCKITSRDKTLLSEKYLIYLLPKKLKEIEDKTSFVTVKHLSVKAISNIEFPLPPLHIQEQIADTLDKADALRRKDQELLQKYDELAQAIFYDMFGDPVRNEKGWEVIKLGELCSIRRGASPRPIEKFIGNDVHWVKIGDGTGEDTMYISDTKVKITEEGSRKSVLLQPGALIFANCGVSLGFARILNITGCIHDGWLSLEIKDQQKLDQVFLLKLINTITQYLRGLAPEGTQPNLNTAIMKDLNIIVPPIKKQILFHNIVKKVSTVTKSANKSSLITDNLFHGMQNKLFS